MSKPVVPAAPLGVEQALGEIRAQLERLSFGTIAITVHEGKIVQLDVTEKRRLG